jgi:hypothetical protein
MSDKPLSATMVACIDMARDAGGELVRYQGGYWAPRGVCHPTRSTGTDCGWHNSSTVQAIVSRGHAKYTEHRRGRSGEFPIAMRLTENAA